MHGSTQPLDFYFVPFGIKVLLINGHVIHLITFLTLFFKNCKKGQAKVEIIIPTPVVF